MTDADRLVLHGSFTSSSTYKPMLFLALSGLPFSFRTVNLKNGVQKQRRIWRSTATARCRCCSIAGSCW
jgi:hypothetical protein